MVVARCVGEKPDDQPRIVYIISRSRLCPRYVNRRESPTAKQETMIGSAGIRVLPNNLATVVDTVRKAGRRSRWVDRGKTAAAQPKAVINPPPLSR